MKPLGKKTMLSIISMGIFTLQSAKADMIDLYMMGVLPSIVGSSNKCLTHLGKTYCEVTSPYTDKVWLDRNMGAARVCTTLDDTACFGDYYQWGRKADGHEDQNSGITTAQANDVNDAGTPDFMISFGDWAASTIDDNGSTRSANWSNINGSYACPAEYRVPTLDEFKAELLDSGSAEIDNRDEAFESFLKLPSAGFRDSGDGTMKYQDSLGMLWSSTARNQGASLIDFESNDAGIGYSALRNYGQSVRCIKGRGPA